MDFRHLLNGNFMSISPKGELLSINWEKTELVAQAAMEKGVQQWNIADAVAVALVAVRRDEEARTVALTLAVKGEMKDALKRAQSYLAFIQGK